MIALREKTTINLPIILKEEIKKWEKGIELASKDEAYMQFCQELGNDDGGIA